MTAMLAGSDFLPRPTCLPPPQPEGFKEWHHFVIHGSGRRLLINFSLTQRAVAHRSTSAGAPRHCD